MALNVDLRELTQPGATGNQTISLPANFDPKAIILWSSGRAATGTAATLHFGYGFGTYRSSVVSHACVSVMATDAATVGDTAKKVVTSDLLNLTDNAGSNDLEIDLVSMQGGATSQVVINWVNLFTTASIKVNCLILGGSDITDAFVFNFNMALAVATQDVTVTSGFGQPDFLLLCGNSFDVLGGGLNGSIWLGFGKKGEAGRHLTYGSRDGNTNMFVGMSQRSDLIARVLEPAGTFLNDGDFSLTTNLANWPTDGFEITYGTQATVGDFVLGLALKGTFSVTTGSGTAPTSGTPPVVQNLAHGSPPKLGFVMGWDLVGQTGIVEAGADLGAFFVGAGDGTVELVSGGTDDDAIGTSDCNKFWSNAKVVQNYNQAAALQSEADGLISGNNFQLSWNDIDAVAREYQWFTLGDSAVTEVSQTAAQPWEALQGVRPTAAQPWEAMAFILGGALQPWEALQGVQAVAQQFWEALQGVRPTAAQPWEAMALITVGAGQPWEAMAFVQRGATQAWESLGTVTTAAGQPWESLLGILRAAGQPWESLQGLRPTAQQPWESAGLVQAGATQPWEALLVLSRTAAQPWEALVALIKAAAQPWEALLGLRPGAIQPWEASAFILRGAQQPWEAAGTVQANAQQPWEGLMLLTRTAQQPWESLVRLVRDAQQQWEGLQGLRPTTSQPWEASGIVVVQAPQPWEASGTVQTNASQPWEALLGILRQSAQPWEAKRTIIAVAPQFWEGIIVLVFDPGVVVAWIVPAGGALWIVPEGGKLWTVPDDDDVWTTPEREA